MSMKSSKLTKNDERLLEERISSNKVEYPRSVLRGVGFVAAFLPAYFAHTVFYMEWSAISNIPLLIAVPVATTEMLTRAYMAMIETEFWKRQRHFSEGKGVNESLLRKLRLQVAVGYTLFFINLIFLVLSSVFQIYILRNVDPRASFLLSSCLSAAFVWLLAQSNEESRKRRMRPGSRN
eukprot:Tbor_TRINITY_DN615_c0_g1::TRINITY_DN615_c0_g1_i1::g.1635::m.1635/K13251/SSR3; translocon-associated protein subunit gamma